MRKPWEAWPPLGCEWIRPGRNPPLPCVLCSVRAVCPCSGAFAAGTTTAPFVETRKVKLRGLSDFYRGRSEPWRRLYLNSLVLGKAKSRSVRMSSDWSHPPTRRSPARSQLGTQSWEPCSPRAVDTHPDEGSAECTTVGGSRRNHRHFRERIVFSWGPGGNYGRGGISPSQEVRLEFGHAETMRPNLGRGRSKVTREETVTREIRWEREGAVRS